MVIRIIIFCLLVCYLTNSYSQDVQGNVDICVGTVAEGIPPSLSRPTMPTATVMPFIEPVNVIFVVDDSSSMFNNLMPGAPAGPTNNWQVLKLIKQDLLNLLQFNPQPVNVGIVQTRGGLVDDTLPFSMDFEPGSRYSLGARVAYPVSPLNASSIWDMLNILDVNSTTWATPLADALYETALYVRGEDVDLGTTRDLLVDDFVSHPGSYTGGNVIPGGCHEVESTVCKTEEIKELAGVKPRYNSPITASTPSTHIILVSDGLANAQTREEEMKTLMGLTTCESTYYQPKKGAECMYSLANWLANTDHSSTVPGDQPVKLHTITFSEESSNNYSSHFMSQLAFLGGGESYYANDYDSLVDALTDSVTSAITISLGIPASPIYTPPTHAPSEIPNTRGNILNSTRIAHSIDPNMVTRVGQDAYLAVYKPFADQPWQGNLLKYRYDQSSDLQLIGQNGEPLIVNMNPGSAVQSNSAYNSGSRGFWSSEDNGSDATLGGAASQLPDHNSRHLYTDLNPVAITDSENTLRLENITISDLGLEPDEIQADDLQRIVEWARGELEGQEHFMGDIIHSNPVVVDYDLRPGNEEKLVFVGTNQGYLHAIDGETGVERWAFMPKSLLPNLPRLSGVLLGEHRFDMSLYYGPDEISENGHTYGMDSSPKIWVKNSGDLKLISSAEGDQVMLFIGMRRGGNNYYGFDITNPNQPKLVWTIEGGITAGFENLGQTWSEPQIAKIDVDGTVKTVLIFGGGFDTITGDAFSNPGKVSGLGNNVYMVDAETGDLLWAAGNRPVTGSPRSRILSNMDYSISANVKLLDANLDGLTDMFIVGDLGGQLWRFDIANGNSWSTLIDGGRIASISGNNDDSTSGVYNIRTFYAEPDVVKVSHPTNSEFGEKIAIAIGSGNRPHPMIENNDDHFYVFFQDDIYSKPNSYSTIELGDLINVTNSTDFVSATSNGWYIELNELGAGNKSVSPAKTIFGVTYFSAARPFNSFAFDCMPGTQNDTFAVSIFDGSPVFNDLTSLFDNNSRIIARTTSGALPNNAPDVAITAIGTGLFIGARKIEIREQVGIGETEDFNIIGEIKPQQKSSWSAGGD